MPASDVAPELSALTWPEAKEAIARSRLAILPTGSTEQHGPHLAMATDIALSTYMARKVAQRTGALLLPGFPFGQVWSARDFPGTISLRSETFINVVYDVGESMARHGVRTFAIINGHNGNVPYLRDAVRRLQEGIPQMLSLSFHYPGIREVAGPLRETATWNTTSHERSTSHAEEIETSRLLAAAPELVHMDRAAACWPEAPLAYEHGAVHWSTFNPTGVFGDPTKATSEKGHAILEAVIDNIVSRLSALHGQQ